MRGKIIPQKGQHFLCKDITNVHLCNGIIQIVHLLVNFRMVFLFPKLHKKFIFEFLKECNEYIQLLMIAMQLVQSDLILFNDRYNWSNE